MLSSKQEYLAIKQQYDGLNAVNIDSIFAGLQSKTGSALTSDINSIKDYYNTLTNSTTGVIPKLQKHLDKTTTDILKAEPSVNKERYTERIFPNRTIASREILGGFFPMMHPNTLPFILSGGIFMAALAIFMIFDTLGFRGNVSLPPALAAMSAGPVAFYKNPLVLGGVSVVFLIATIVFAVKYFTK
jgi:hypothetical protein